jgi:recombination protein RecA
MEDLIKEIRENDKDTPIVIAYDSIAVSPTRDELKGEGYEMHNMMGAARAKITGGCLRKINMRLRVQKVALVIINQIREKVGVMYGNPETNAGGGRALEYYLGVDLRCSVNKSDLIKDDDGQLMGIKGKVKNTKNKCSIPFQECEFRLFFDEGLDPYYGLTKLLELDKLVGRNGAWYSCGEEKFQAKTLVEKIEGADKKSPFFKVKEKLGIA